MKCIVCHVSWGEPQAVCPQCGYDQAAPGAREPQAVLSARQAFRDRSTAHAPETRVHRWDRLQPWLAAALGFALFVLWMRACSSGGFRLW